MPLRSHDVRDRPAERGGRLSGIGWADPADVFGADVAVVGVSRCVWCRRSGGGRQQPDHGSVFRAGVAARAARLCLAPPRRPVRLPGRAVPASHGRGAARVGRSRLRAGRWRRDAPALRCGREQTRRVQYSPLITKNEPRIVPASFDFCRANLKRDASSSGTSIPSDNLKPTARFIPSSTPYITLIDRPDS